MVNSFSDMRSHHAGRTGAAPGRRHGHSPSRTTDTVWGPLQSCVCKRARATTRYGVTLMSSADHDLHACVTGRLRGCDAAFDILRPVFSLCSLRSRCVRPARRAVRSVHPSATTFPYFHAHVHVHVHFLPSCGLGCHHADPAGAARPVPSRPIQSSPVQSKSNPVQSNPNPIQSGSVHARERGQLAGPGLGHPRARHPPRACIVHRASCERLTGCAAASRSKAWAGASERARAGRASGCERHPRLPLLGILLRSAPIDQRHKNDALLASRALDWPPQTPRARSIDRARDVARSSVNEWRGIMGGPPSSANSASTDLGVPIPPSQETLHGSVPGLD